MFAFLRSLKSARKSSRQVAASSKPHLEVLEDRAMPTVIATATFQGHTYDLISRQSWQSAEAEAVSLGGHLVAINDQAENDFVRDFGRPYGQTYGFWIGLNDAALEGNFVWADGSTSSYRNRSPGEPNNLNDQDHVLMYIYVVGGGVLPSQDGTWMTIMGILRLKPKALSSRSPN
jgi:hypothetical protein